MTNNNNNINKSNFNSLIEGGISNIRTSRIIITSVFSKLNVFSFFTFISGISYTQKINVTRGHIRLSAVKCILMFYAIQLTHSSEFVKYLYQTGRSYNFPTFCHSYLTFISSKSVTKNKLFGVTEGTLEPDFILQDIITLINNDHDYVIKLLSGTIFESILRDLTDKKSELIDLQPFIDLFNDYVFSLMEHTDSLSRDQEFELLTLILSDFSTCLQTSTQEFTSMNRYKTSDSTSLSIYRYRNTENEGPELYTVQQSTIVSLGLPALLQQAAFLNLFEPQFSSGKSFISGDVIIDVSLQKPVEAWKAYIACKLVTTKRPGPQRTGNSSGRSQTTNNISNTPSVVTENNSTTQLVYVESFYNDMARPPQLSDEMLVDYSVTSDSLGNHYILTCSREVTTYSCSKSEVEKFFESLRYV